MHRKRAMEEDTGAAEGKAGLSNAIRHIAGG